MQKANDGNHDTVLWMLTYKYPAKEFLEIARQRYNKTKSVAWLLAFARQVHASGGSTYRSDVITALASVSTSHPGYYTAQNYRGQLFLAQQNKLATLQLAQTVLADPKLNQRRDVRSAFLDLAMQSSDGLAEKLSYAFRPIVGLAYEKFIEIGGADEVDQIDSKAADLMNYGIPIDEWLPAIRKANVSETSRRFLLDTLLFRAFLLNRVDIMRLAATELDMKSLSRASDDRIRYEYARVYLGEDSKNPNPDLVSSNQKGINPGWCFDEHAEDVDSIDERKTLTKQMPIDAMGSMLLDFASRFPGEPTLPENLHLYVARTRYEQCKSDETGNISKKFFDLLHTKYPNDSWTVKTPYWYN